MFCWRWKYHLLFSRNLSYWFFFSFWKFILDKISYSVTFSSSSRSLYPDNMSTSAMIFSNLMLFEMMKRNIEHGNIVLLFFSWKVPVSRLEIWGDTYNVKEVEILMALNDHWAWNEHTLWYFRHCCHFKTAMDKMKLHRKSIEYTENP